ncbi:MAG: hypothetical protein AMS21_02735 [Gemmatimonas sp. SG8_38_2]|nr:MAG: hypothetical protein AMS21_02735 [Gemmatimonas sp. SG8_38_2]
MIHGPAAVEPIVDAHVPQLQGAPKVTLVRHEGKREQILVVVEIERFVIVIGFGVTLPDQDFVREHRIGRVGHVEDLQSRSIVDLCYFVELIVDTNALSASRSTRHNI